MTNLHPCAPNARQEDFVCTVPTNGLLDANVPLPCSYMCFRKCRIYARMRAAARRTCLAKRPRWCFKCIGGISGSQWWPLGWRVRLTHSKAQWTPRYSHCSANASWCSSTTSWFTARLWMTTSKISIWCFPIWLGVSGKSSCATLRNRVSHIWDMSLATKESQMTQPRSSPSKIGCCLKMLNSFGVFSDWPGIIASLSNTSWLLPTPHWCPQ